MNTSLYNTLKAAGIEMNNHESDLYVKVTPQSTAILLTFPTHFENAQRFIDRTNGDLTYDVPFAFEPYWDAKALIERQSSQAVRK